MNKKYKEYGSRTRPYRIWCSMKQRCYYNKSVGFKNYGGRGIVVCDEWKNNYLLFLDWALANGYSDQLTLDRIDSNGNYEPSNCRWVSYVQQNNNSSNNVLLTFNGVTHTIAEWSRIVGLKKSTIEYRKRIGWSDEKALTTPLLQKSLTKEQVDNIRNKRKNGVSCKELSKEYNIGLTTVYELIKGKTYKKYE